MKALPSLKQLQYLVALSHTLHFGKAAEACFVTQSTLSAGIRDLENLLNAPIAERTKRSVIFTPLGEELALRAKKLLRSAEDIVKLAHKAPTPLSGTIRLGVIPTIGPYLLPRILPKIYKTYPKLQLFLREDTTHRLLEKLEAGQLDVVLLALPYQTGDLQTQVLFNDLFQLACPAAHPLAKKSKVTHKDLRNFPLMLLEDGHCLRAHALAACHLDGLSRVKNVEATSLPTLVQMVPGGMGLTLLPQLAIDAGLADNLNIALVPLIGPATSRQISLVWRKTSPNADEFALLGKALTFD